MRVLALSVALVAVPMCGKIPPPVNTDPPTVIVHDPTQVGPTVRVPQPPPAVIVVVPHPPR